MFSESIYVGKDLFIKKRASDLLCEYLGRGGAISNIRRDWMNNLANPVSEMFDEAGSLDDVSYFTSFNGTDDNKISFFFWKKFNAENQDSDYFVNTAIPLLIFDKGWSRNWVKAYRSKNLFFQTMCKSFIERLNDDNVKQLLEYDHGVFNFETFSHSGDEMFTINSCKEVHELLRPKIKLVLGTVKVSVYSQILNKVIGFVFGNVFVAVRITGFSSEIEFQFLPFFFYARMSDSYKFWPGFDLLNKPFRCEYNYFDVDNEEISPNINFNLYGSFSQQAEQFVLDYICVPGHFSYSQSYSALFNSADLLRLDEKKAELPVIPASKLTNSSEGLFDIFWNESNRPDEKYYFKMPLDKRCVARDPWELVKKDCQVAIDFGTASTVVATRDAHENVSLVRMGKYSEEVNERQYENPTVLNFVDYQSFLRDWTDLPYRPDTSFNDLKFSHSAKEEREDHPRSCMSSIKTWARTDNAHQHLRLMDEQNFDFELKHPELYDKEDSVEDFRTADLNPIEVYAYLLGCCLNNQSLGNGSIYLNYSMTFPAKFDVATKRRIMQGFRNGLLRSLPPSLVYSGKWSNDRLKLQECASEPIALAASFLEALEIEPTEDGIAFGVFDFGGGTTDFAMGLYRQASDEENDDYGWEQVLDIIDTSGDSNLGGEHLVNLLVHETIKDNLETVIEKGYRFILPPPLTEFKGSELVWGNSLGAYENSSKLARKLRSIWETGALCNDDAEPTEDSELLVMLKDCRTEGDAEANLCIDQEKFRELIKEKIRDGIRRFFAMTKNALSVSETSISTLHLLFSGNSCRSPLTRQVLNEFQESRDFGFEDDSIDVVFHIEFLDADDLRNPSSEENAEGDESSGNDAEYLRNLTANNPDLSPKTGVALGLLKILPGENTGYCDRRITSADNFEAPFNYYVGKIVRGQISPVLKRNYDYINWVSLGKVNRNHITKIAWTTDTLLEEGAENISITTHRINHKPEQEGWSIFIKPHTPSSVKVAVSRSGEICDLEDEEIIPL